MFKLIYNIQLAEKGDPEAQFKMAVSYYNGNSTHKNYKLAKEWYEKAAKQGHEKAQFNLGIMYESGKYINQDYKEAFKWFRRSAEQGNAMGQYNLSVLYYKGLGIEKDYVKAYNWCNLSLAEDENNSSAKDLLNILEENMNPTEIEKAQALSSQNFKIIFLEKCLEALESN